MKNVLRIGGEIKKIDPKMFQIKNQVLGGV